MLVVSLCQLSRLTRCCAGTSLLGPGPLIQTSSSIKNEPRQPTRFHDPTYSDRTTADPNQATAAPYFRHSSLRGPAVVAQGSVPRPAPHSMTKWLTCNSRMTMHSSMTATMTHHIEAPHPSAVCEAPCHGIPAECPRVVACVAGDTQTQRAARQRCRHKRDLRPRRQARATRFSPRAQTKPLVLASTTWRATSQRLAK